MAAPTIDAGVQLWACVTRLCAQRGLLRPRQQMELRTAALAAIAALNGRPAPVFGRIDRGAAKAIFTALAVELARGGVENTDLAAWLDESWADRERSRRERT